MMTSVAPSAPSSRERDDVDEFARLLDARARLIAAADDIADVLDRWPETPAEQWTDSAIHYSGLVTRAFFARCRPRPSRPRGEPPAGRHLQVIPGGAQ